MQPAQRVHGQKKKKKGNGLFSFKRLTGGVLIGWISTALSIGVGLFMSPFLIHHLGEGGYGVWVLIQSTVSYMYFMDLGLRTTVVRFAAQAQARADHVGVSNVVSAALWMRLWTAAGIVAISGTLVAALPHLFHIPSAYLATARVAMLIVAVTLCSTLVFSVFTAVLAGLGRFDLLSLLELAQVAFSSLGLVPIILSGHGLIWMAAWGLGVVLAVNMVMLWVCFRIYPHLKLHFHKPEAALLRSLWSVGVYVLICSVAGELILYTDNIVVGAFVAAAAVSYYAVAGKMVEYTRQIAFSVLKMFMPMASSFGALNQFDRLRKLHVRGTQVVLLVTYPIVITLIFRGDMLLRLWIGERFSAQTTVVLQLLACAAAAMLANSSNQSLTLALDKQRTLAWTMLAEGLANLVLSILLVRRIGVLGVAIGTLIPTLVTSLFFWPRYLCRLVGIPLWEYLRDAWGRPVLAMMPFLAASVWAERSLHPAHLITFVLQTIALLPAIALGATILFWKDVPVAWRFLTKRQLAVAAS